MPTSALRPGHIQAAHDSNVSKEVLDEQAMLQPGSCAQALFQDVESLQQHGGLSSNLHVHFFLRKQQVLERFYNNV
eukprot:4609466-Ditylum_brightwellii.AAC.1